MKRTEAIIRPSKLDEVKLALRRLSIGGMTVSEVRGYGRQRGRSERYRGTEYAPEFVPKVRIELYVANGDVGDTMDVLVRAARTGDIGDGKIYVSDIPDALRIRTSERGEGAL